MPKQSWLVKQEPGSYPWEKFVQDRGTAWTGIRNYQARNFLRAMQKGELVLYYHSGEERRAVGLARVGRSAYPDPTAAEGDWSAVDLVPVKPLRKAVSLAEIKADPLLHDLPLLKQSRLSVTPIDSNQMARLLELAETKP